MNYFPPFEVIRRSVEISTVRGELRVSLTYEEFVKLLKLMISGMDVDESWARDQAPGIDLACALAGRRGERGGHASVDDK